VKFMAIFLSPTKPLIKSDLTECLSGGFQVLMKGDLNAKHTEWNSRLITARGSLLRYYANTNSCLLPDLWAGPPNHSYLHIKCKLYFSNFLKRLAICIEIPLANFVFRFHFRSSAKSYILVSSNLSINILTVMDDNRHD
jgi:hypothetical protein